ncbi:hypothetical protein ACWDG1_41090 [Streptomyces sp. NPDC001177]
MEDVISNPRTTLPRYEAEHSPGPGASIESIGDGMGLPNFLKTGPATVYFLPDLVLPPLVTRARRIFKHPRLMHYNRLIVLILAVNLVIATFGLTSGARWSGSHPSNSTLKDLALIAQTNLGIAIIFRQQYVVNALSWLATHAPKTWPLRIRWLLAKIYHFGGLHVGAAVSGMLWYAAFVWSMTRSAIYGHTLVANLVLSYAVLALLLVMVVMALPPLRSRFHDQFELTHRFCGWSVLVLAWANTVVLLGSQRGEMSVLQALLTAPTIWILLVTTGSGMLTWLRLRHVPITVEKPSRHAAIVKLDHGKDPLVGSVRAISRHPLAGWHYFANLPISNEPGGGYRMVISRAGDWTSKFIDHPPSHVWVRGIPTAGMANSRRLFRRVVYVATGSGIGPMLAHLMINEVPGHLVWVTRDPRKTYGDTLVDEILAAQPDATVWNTDVHGKPDMLRLAYAAFAATGAEAVICIANKRVTWQIVYGLECRGIPAFGPIWDS